MGASDAGHGLPPPPGSNRPRARSVSATVTTPADDPAPPTPRQLGTFATLGFAVGAATVGTLWRLYPPPPGPKWMVLPTIAVCSLLALLAATLVTHRRRGELAAQWLLVGYAVAMLLWGTVAVSEETVSYVRGHISSSLGVAGV